MKLLIDSIQRDIHNNWINSGGCVHFAYYISKALCERNIKHSILVCNYSYAGSCINWEKIGASHLIVECGKYKFDATNYINDDYIDIKYFDVLEIKGCLSTLKILNNVRKKDIWCNWYNRSYNSTLSKIITKNFKIYDNRRE
jgi:hypothetical protein